MRRKKQKKSMEPAEARDEDLRDDEGEETPPVPELAEKPKGPNGRLTRSQRWTKQSDNLMKYSAEDVRNATMEFIGPGARDALLRYNGGSKMAAAGEVEAAKAKALDIAKHAKEVAKHAKTAADDAEFLVKALDTHYIDLLTGQGNLDDVGEGGRHRESKPQVKPEPEPAPAAAPAEASAPAEGGALVPPGGPVQAKEVAEHLLNLIRQQVQQPEAVDVQVEEPKGLLGDGSPRRPQDIPGIDPMSLETYEGPETLREFGRAIGRSDKSMGMAPPADLDGYVGRTLDSITNLSEGAPAIELTDAERAELRAGLAEGAGIEEPAAGPEGGEEFQALLGRAREQGRADAPHNRQLHDAGILAEVLKISPTHPSAAVLFAAYMESYEGAGGAAAAESEQAAGGETSAPKQRGRRGGRRG